MVQNHRISIVCASTGSGKSTVLPTALFTYTLKPVICTSPTVAATIGLYDNACRTFHGLKIGSAYGGIVDYDTDSEVTYATAGHLKNVLARKGMGHHKILILDEAHTVSVDMELLVAFLQYTWKNNPDIHILISSATMDAEMIRSWQALLPGTHIPRIDIDVPSHEVTVTYSDIDYRIGEPSLYHDIVQHITHKVNPLETPGHILVFLSGEAAINTVYNLLFAEPTLKNCSVYVAHARLPHASIDEAFKQPHVTDNSFRSIILATDIAETSITIPDVAFVIDSGTQKLVQLDSTGEISVLKEEKISRFSATQRKGRTGRTCAGSVHRMYSKATMDYMSNKYTPEILRKPLHQTVMQLLRYNYSPFSILQYLNVPARTIDDAIQLLSTNKLIDTGNDIPTLSVEALSIVNVPTSILLARIAYAAIHSNMTSFEKTIALLAVAAAETERTNSLLYIPYKGRQTEEEYKEMLRERYLDLYDRFQQGSICPLNSSVNCLLLAMKVSNKLRGKWANENGLNKKAMDSALNLFQRLCSYFRHNSKRTNHHVDRINEAFKRTIDVVKQVAGPSEIYARYARDKWRISQSDPIFYRLSRRGFQNDAIGDHVVALIKGHVQKSDHTMRFLSVVVPISH